MRDDSAGEVVEARQQRLARGNVEAAIGACSAALVGRCLRDGRVVVGWYSMRGWRALGRAWLIGSTRLKRASEAA